MEALYGALQTSCQREVAKSILLKYADESNGVAVWQELIEEFGNGGDKESRIAKLETVVNNQYTKSYKGGLRGWIMDYQNAFAQLEMLGELSYADEESKKRKIIQNCVPKDSKDAVILKELCANKTYKQTCKMIRVHAIASEDRKPRGVHNTLVSQLADIIAQKLHVESSEPEEDLHFFMMANLTRVSPEVWIELPRDAQAVII